MNFEKMGIYKILMLFRYFHCQTEALGKPGNIVAEALRFLSMFVGLPTSGNIAAETKFAS